MKTNAIRNITWPSALVGIIFSIGSAPREVCAQAGWGPNRVSNASFEEHLDYWNPRVGAMQDGEAVFSNVEIDSSEAYTGVYSLKLSGDASVTRWWAIESEPIPATPGKRYRFGAYMKSEDVRQEEGQYLNANVYIQFRDSDGQVLDIAGATVRGTQPLTGTRNWMNVYAYAVAPEETAQARIGCALTCSGAIWFDDIVFQESEDVTWASRRTRNFAYFFAMGEEPPDDVLDENEQVAERILKLLDMEPREQVKFFKYHSTLEMQETRARDATASAADEAVHSVSWRAPPFTVARILAGRLGSSTRIFEEGLATYLADRVAGAELHGRARELAKSDSLPSLFGVLEDVDIEIVLGGARRNTVYGSFVGWLIEAQGIDQFKRVFGFEGVDAAKRELPGKFKEVYGLALQEAEAEWRKFLKGA